MSFCGEFHALPYKFNFLCDPIKRIYPAELGMTDLFMCSLAYHCGDETNGKTLQKLEFSNDESKEGYDFMMEFKIANLTYRYYLQAKCAKRIERNGSKYVDWLYGGETKKGGKKKTGIQEEKGDKDEKNPKQWELLREFVAKQIAINHYNDGPLKIMGLYIVYDREGVCFIPIGKLHALSVHPTENIWFDNSEYGNATIYDHFRGKETYTSVDILFNEDSETDKYALEHYVEGTGEKKGKPGKPVQSNKILK